MLALQFNEWKDRPLGNITGDMVISHHARLAERHGAARANLGMRLLSALFNFAGATQMDRSGRSLFPENPVRRLTAVRGWYRVKRRETVIHPRELPVWLQAVETLRDGTV